MGEYKPEPQKTITGKDAEMFINLKADEFTKTFVKKYFSQKATVENRVFKRIPPKFNTYDKIDIPVGKYNNNKQVIHTHIGKFLFFKFMFEGNTADIVKLEDYLDNKGLDAKAVESMTQKMSNAVLLKKITTDQMIDYLDKLQFWFGLSSLFNSSMSLKTGKPLPKVMKEKERLIKENKEAIEAGDTLVAAKIEKQLLELAEKELGNDYGMDLYKSGANASFSNNYKAMFVMKGPVKDNLTGETHVITSNYSDGMKKEDLHSHFDSLVYGAYSKGVGTQNSGYLTKKFLAAYQGIVLDKKNTDCGTKLLFNIKITKFNKNMCRYQYIEENGKLVLLTDSLLDKYVGKTVRMRLPGGCTGNKICNKCAGEYYYMLDDDKLGLTTIVASGSLLNKSMKKFHDTSVKLKRLNIDEIIL